MKNTQLEALLEFMEDFHGKGMEGYGFGLRPLDSEHTLQSLKTGNGKSRFTPFEVGNGESGVMFGYKDDDKQNQEQDDNRWMILFESTESIDSLIETLKTARKIIRKHELYGDDS